MPDEDLTVDLYVVACARLEATGIKQYEISNFARGGSESRHNLKYWTRQSYLGFGVDAHSMLIGKNKPSRERRNVKARHRQCREHTTNDKSPAGTARNTNYAVRYATADSLETYVAGGKIQPTHISQHTALEESSSSWVCG